MVIFSTSYWFYRCCYCFERCLCLWFYSFDHITFSWCNYLQPNHFNVISFHWSVPFPPISRRWCHSFCSFTLSYAGTCICSTNVLRLLLALAVMFFSVLSGRVDDQISIIHSIEVFPTPLLWSDSIIDTIIVSMYLLQVSLILSIILA